MTLLDAGTLRRPTPRWNPNDLVPTKLRVIGAMVLRDFRTRILGNKLGLVWALIEPLLFVIGISIVVSMIDRHPRIGDSFLLYFATGIIPFNAFRRICRSVTQAGKRYRNCLFIPIIQPIDPYIATMIVDLMIQNFVYFSFFIGYDIIIGGGIPHDWFMTFYPLWVNAVIGLGVGLINLSISSYFTAWPAIFGILTMPLMIFSGVLHLIDEFPTEIQNFLWYNPMAHSVCASRMGFYQIYVSYFYSFNYFVMFAFIVLGVGIIAEKMARPRILKLLK